MPFDPGELAGRKLKLRKTKNRGQSRGDRYAELSSTQQIREDNNNKMETPSRCIHTSLIEVVSIRSSVGPSVYLSVTSFFLSVKFSKKSFYDTSLLRHQSATRTHHCSYWNMSKSRPNESILLVS